AEDGTALARRVRAAIARGTRAARAARAGSIAEALSRDRPAREFVVQSTADVARSVQRALVPHDQRTVRQKRGPPQAHDTRVQLRKDRRSNALVRFDDSEAGPRGI